MFQDQVNFLKCVDTQETSYVEYRVLVELSEDLIAILMKLILFPFLCFSLWISNMYSYRFTVRLRV